MTLLPNLLPFIPLLFTAPLPILTHPLRVSPGHRLGSFLWFWSLDRPKTSLQPRSRAWSSYVRKAEGPPGMLQRLAALTTLPAQLSGDGHFPLPGLLFFFLRPPLLGSLGSCANTAIPNG